MPQVDLESLDTSSACQDNGSKIVRENIPDDDIAANDSGEIRPESFWLSRESIYNLLDISIMYKHKESTKGSSNYTNNLNRNSSSNSNSENLKSKASIICLPKTQKTTYADSIRRSRKTANMRLFHKLSGSAGQSTAEPSSPKVTCMGKVRSKRCRRRLNSLRKREKPVEMSRGGSKKVKTGFYSKVMSMFRSKKGRKKPVRSGSRKVADKEAAMVEEQRKSARMRLRQIPVSVEPVTEAPGLGEIKRFTSSRRSGSWTAEDLNRAILKSLDLDRKIGPSLR